MNKFEELQKSWMAQPIQKPSETDFAKLKQKISRVERKQWIANIVFLTTIVVLVYFFYYVKAIQYQSVAIALIVMIGVLVIRAVLESFSLSNLRTLSATLEIEKFKVKLKKYHKQRIIVHVVLTPILLTLYSLAFWTMLPDFKASLSKGFYTYILISSIVLLFFFSFFIFFQVRKELRTLKTLREG
ncbi:hypothetical protein ACOKFD_12750 [Flagellimonas sp. S174]|uniref:hypothetical protein n=1 Tax=Flagellimonas sp. S174 TaxID=3410790 RepID=UPI003BF59800